MKNQAFAGGALSPGRTSMPSSLCPVPPRDLAQDIPTSLTSVTSSVILSPAGGGSGSLVGLVVLGIVGIGGPSRAGVVQPGV